MNEEKFLGKGILDILENENMNIIEFEKNENGYFLEMEFRSGAGENIIIDLLGKNREELFKDFVSQAEDFDAEEHAEMWIDGRGHFGIPNSIRTLLDDADEIKETLEDVSEKCMKEIQKEKNKEIQK